MYVCDTNIAKTLLMNRDIVIEAFSSIGLFLSQFESFHSEKTNITLNKKFYEPFSSAITSAKHAFINPSCVISYSVGSTYIKNLFIINGGCLYFYYNRFWNE